MTQFSAIFLFDHFFFSHPHQFSVLFVLWPSACKGDVLAVKNSDMLQAKYHVNISPFHKETRLDNMLHHITTF